MPRRGRRKYTRKEPESDDDMEVVEEDPVADVEEDAEVVVDDEEQDMLSEGKEDELDEDDQGEGDEVRGVLLESLDPSLNIRALGRGGRRCRRGRRRG